MVRVTLCLGRCLSDCSVLGCFGWRSTARIAHAPLGPCHAQAAAEEGAEALRTAGDDLQDCLAEMAERAKELQRERQELQELLVPPRTGLSGRDAVRKSASGSSKLHRPHANRKGYMIRV